jgi:hypothetical protein
MHVRRVANTSRRIRHRVRAGQRIQDSPDSAERWALLGAFAEVPPEQVALFAGVSR